MRTLLAALLLASSTAFAACPTTPPPPATPTQLYYDEADRAAWDAAVIAGVAGTARDHQTAINLGYVLAQARRILFIGGSPTAFTEEDQAFFTAVAAASLEGAGLRSGTSWAPQDYSPIASKASTYARLVMDFRKTRIC